MRDVLVGRQKAVTAAIVTLLSVAASSTTSVLVNIGETASFADVTTIGWLTIATTTLGATGLVTMGVERVENRKTARPGVDLVELSPEDAASVADVDYPSRRDLRDED